MPISLKDVPDETLREFAHAIIKNGVDGAMVGNPWDIEWLGSDDARFYYDILDLDYNKIISVFIRRYLDNRNSENRVRAWSRKKIELVQEATKQIQQERRQKRIAVRI